MSLQYAIGSYGVYHHPVVKEHNFWKLELFNYPKWFIELYFVVNYKL